MNNLYKFLLRYEKPLKYSAVIIGSGLIMIGISMNFLKEWLVSLGDSYAMDGDCITCRKFIDLFKTPLIIVGSFLSFPLIFEKQIVKLYEKCAIKQKMNSLHKFLIRYEEPLKYTLVIIGFSLIIMGISMNLLKEWLISLGDSYAMDGYCCMCRNYFFLYKILLIIVGSFLSFPLIFERQIVKLYEKCAIKQKTVLATFLFLIFIMLGIISYITFHNFPYSYDEYNFLYQAKIFSDGKLFIEEPEILRPFKEVYMVLKDNKLFSKYPPGFPLILSVGVLLNIPGLINPLIAVLTLIILYLFAKTFFEIKYGLLSVIIMSTTPYFLGYSASYYSHPTSLLLTSLIFLFVRTYELTFKKKYLYLLGLVSGLLFMTRPLDSFCVIVPSHLYLIYILYKNENLKKICYSISIFTIVFSLFLTYNYILTGKISIATYPVFRSDFKVVDSDAVDSIQNISSIMRKYFNNGIKIIPEMICKYFLIHTGVFIPLFAIFGLFFFESKWKWVLILNFLMLIIFYNFVPGNGWPQYGARYYYSGYVSLAILATASFKHLIEKINSKNFVMYFLTFVLCVHILFSFKLFNDYAYRFKVKLAIIEDIRNNCQDNSIVILNPNVANSFESDCLRKVSFLDLGSEKRNMFMNTSQMMAYRDDKYLDLSQLKSYFPDRSICYYNYNKLKDLLTNNIASN